MVLRPLASLALGMSLAGCGSVASTRSCTEIGCMSRISVVVDEPGERPLEACVGAACSTADERAPNELFLDGLEVGDDVEVVVRVAGGGADVARAKVAPGRHRPNGPGCPPECRSARLRLTVEDLLVPA